MKVARKSRQPGPSRPISALPFDYQRAITRMLTKERFFSKCSRIGLRTMIHEVAEFSLEFAMATRDVQAAARYLRLSNATKPLSQEPTP